MVLERVYMAQLLTAECLTPERLGHRSPVAQIIQYAMRAYILAPIAVSNADAAMSTSKSVKRLYCVTPLFSIRSRSASTSYLRGLTWETARSQAGIKESG